MRKGADLAFAKNWCCGGQCHLMWPEQVRCWLVMLLQGYFNKVRYSSMGIQQFFGLTLSHNSVQTRCTCLYTKTERHPQSVECLPHREVLAEVLSSVEATTSVQGQPSLHGAHYTSSQRASQTMFFLWQQLPPHCLGTC